MTLSERIALAEKLGYRHEWQGLMDAATDAHIPWIFKDDTDYLRGYEDGRMILERGEGL